MQVTNIDPVSQDLMEAAAASQELTNAASNFLHAFLGEENFTRWHMLRKHHGFSSNVNFTSWLLDGAEDDKNFAEKDITNLARSDSTNSNQSIPKECSTTSMPPCSQVQVSSGLQHASPLNKHIKMEPSDNSAANPSVDTQLVKAFGFVADSNDEDDLPRNRNESLVSSPNSHVRTDDSNVLPLPDSKNSNWVQDYAEVDFTERNRLEMGDCILDYEVGESSDTMDVENATFAHSQGDKDSNAQTQPYLSIKDPTAVGATTPFQQEFPTLSYHLKRHPNVNTNFDSVAASPPIFPTFSTPSDTKQRPNCLAASQNSLLNQAINNSCKRQMPQKVYKCTICERMFNHQASLQVHHRIHTGSKPFTCEVCGQQFNDASNCKRHVRSRHAIQEKQVN